MKLFILPLCLSFFLGPVFAKPDEQPGGSDFETCVDQKQCLGLTWSKEQGRCGCTYTVCLTPAWPQGDCQKEGPFSHMCSSSQCSSSTPMFDVSLQDVTPSAQAAIQWCQQGSAGSTMYFIFKDGQGCGGQKNAYLDLSDDTQVQAVKYATLEGNGLEAVCFPRPETYTPPGASVSEKFPMCGGVGNIGQECVWMVKLPGCNECVYSDWSTWTSCAEGETSRTRRRSVLNEDAPDCFETEGAGSCPTEIQVCHWSDWTSCSSGLDVRTRSKVDQHGDDCLDDSDVEKEPCTPTPTRTSSRSRTPTPTPTRTSTPTPTPTSTPTPTPSPTPTPTPSPTPTPTPSPTPTPPPTLTPSSTATCTPTAPKVTEIYAGQFILVGKLTVTLNGPYLKFEILLYDPWHMSSLHIYVGSVPPPTSASQGPAATAPGQFPVVLDGLTPVGTFTYLVELSELNLMCDSNAPFYIAVHMDVEGPSTETAWCWNKIPDTGKDAPDVTSIDTMGWGRYFTYWVDCNCRGTCKPADNWIEVRGCDAPCGQATKGMKAVVTDDAVPCIAYKEEPCEFANCAPCSDSKRTEVLQDSSSAILGSVSITWTGGLGNYVTLEIALFPTIAQVSRYIFSASVWIGQAPSPASPVYQSTQKGGLSQIQETLIVHAQEFGIDCATRQGKIPMTVILSITYTLQSGKKKYVFTQSWDNFYIECFCGYHASLNNAAATRRLSLSQPFAAEHSGGWSTIVAAVCSCLGGAVIIVTGVVWYRSQDEMNNPAEASPVDL